MSTELTFTENLPSTLNQLIERLSPKGIFCLADTNTATAVANHLIESTPALSRANLITIPAGDHNKSLETLASIWQQLSNGGATRHSLLINIGGGVVTDIGGFAAATFKRGIRFINVPTSLLAAVDASVGGKTGINFAGLKNEIGSFASSEAVVISSSTFTTLPHNELTSGYAELLKHALLDSTSALNEALAYDLQKPDMQQLQHLLKQSVEVKRRIVNLDPKEQGLRKALNLGHTIAHALESHAMSQSSEIAHGHAVAFGLIVDLVLSNMQFNFPSSVLSHVAAFVRENYPAPQITCDHYQTLIDIMSHDKKNPSPDHISFALLRSVGNPEINCEASPDQIKNAIDIARDLLGI